MVMQMEFRCRWTTELDDLNVAGISAVIDWNVSKTFILIRNYMLLALEIGGPGGPGI